ncbi:CpsB/CapC family capsule biosynthesis tyrosine phosphatase [Zunongwangia sp. F363]|uniref:protein-tyrosine-phosphatase n=1 Tax=Autumnicola tepida TaxID=3075595 RepID=A0ABU3CE07_9FLAO|nr:CpsB/CapC family capsule biosynthesis tyrosine phosphatase [Zunongwangia sp. F363]MDT0644570.1 CpsB/CapC family capsule biosynthesis tyrosine phosphatase [Zunongwangia sp. F363]
MLSIFQKKEYLADYLEGFTDFHNHLLPGIDDGSASIEESLELIKKFGEFGINSFVATPHVMGEYYPNTPESIKEALEQLNEKLPENVKLKAAAEYMMDQHFLDILEADTVLSISGKHILVEMSFFQPPINLNEILFKIQNKGLKPILAHPERYPFYHSKDLQQYEEVKSRGCKLQLNMLSLSGHYGPGIKKMANILLDHGLIDFISSDCHRIEHLVKIQGLKLPKKRMELIKPVIANSKVLFN